ncbi:AbrB/MazE/SpoVT family DNA-binding domain-containing protein [Nitrosopumilus sp.]|uniref:AbrB/MazE/SpoVT family DNA-binding domain-containing protein n=1 Tax=Nitrosopumilus sp. TaxID=2024843 RepID=UPI0029301BA1|nr:AbrB/MazE/SpoVT family DNA-binding domain-containing protein [Nitrosopumilus sp.]
MALFSPNYTKTALKSSQEYPELNQNLRLDIMSKFKSIRNIWIEGGTTHCVSLPAEIVKELNLKQDDYLLVELVNDSLIVMKKHNPQFTKSEISKVIGLQNNIVENKPIVINEEQEFKKPLDGMDL